MQPEWNRYGAAGLWCPRAIGSRGGDVRGEAGVRTFGILAVLAAFALSAPAFAFYDLENYAKGRARADSDPGVRTVLDARIDGIASGLFTANGLHSDGMYREGFFCLSYNVTLSLTDFYALLGTRVLEYRQAKTFDQAKGQSVAATLEFELRRHYPCGRDRGDPFPNGYVFPDGTPASAYRMKPPGETLSMPPGALPPPLPRPGAHAPPSGPATGSP
jgi:hypothetical protein